MVHGLETRVPFQDHELVELGGRIRPAAKLADRGKGVQLLWRLALLEMWLPRHGVAWVMRRPGTVAPTMPAGAGPDPSVRGASKQRGRT